jgi:hypothetical protein
LPDSFSLLPVLFISIEENVLESGNNFSGEVYINYTKQGMIQPIRCSEGGHVMGEDDRRKFQRRRKQSVISFHLIEESGEGKIRKAVVVDGSGGGIRFRAGESISKNTRIYIKLDSEVWGDELTYFCKENGNNLVEVIASVMWCLENENSPGEFEIGTRFISQVEQ